MSTTSQRGLVISAPIKVAGQSLHLVTSALDAQELRSALLFWDKLEYPTTNAIHIEGGPDVDFLISAGILRRTHTAITGSGDMAQIFLAAHLNTYKILDQMEPGVWSLGTGKNSISFPERDLEAGRGILLQLYEAIPVPDKEVALQDILEFRAKTKDELLALRFHLDAIYQRILAAGDGPLALQSEVASLEKSIGDYIKSSRRSAFPFVNMSLDANLNVPAAVVAGMTTYTTGLGVVASLLAGAAAGFGLGPSASLKGHADSATPFRYISSFHNRVF